MKTYEFTLKHDGGTATVQVTASTLGAAKYIVLNSEKCPETAITSWRVVPTARQIRKTKNLLRGI